MRILNRYENDLVAEDVKSVTDFAVNGVLFMYVL